MILQDVKQNRVIGEKDDVCGGLNVVNVSAVFERNLVYENWQHAVNIHQPKEFQNN